MNTPGKPFAVVTSAWSGIELELAKEFSRNSFDVLLVGIDKVIAGSLKTKAMGLATESLEPAAPAEFHRKMSEPCSAGK